MSLSIVENYYLADGGDPGAPLFALLLSPEAAAEVCLLEQTSSVFNSMVGALEVRMSWETHLLDKSIACEVVGLQLWEPVDDRTIDELRALWARHPVLVFRRQALSEDELADFSARFGSLERVVRTDWASPVRPEVGVISNLAKNI